MEPLGGTRNSIVASSRHLCRFLIFPQAQAFIHTAVAGFTLYKHLCFVFALLSCEDRWLHFHGKKTLVCLQSVLACPHCNLMGWGQQGILSTSVSLLLVCFFLHLQMDCRTDLNGLQQTPMAANTWERLTVAFISCLVWSMFSYSLNYFCFVFYKP